MLSLGLRRDPFSCYLPYFPAWAANRAFSSPFFLSFPPFQRISEGGLWTWFPECAPIPRPTFPTFLFDFFSPLKLALPVVPSDPVCLFLFSLTPIELAPPSARRNFRQEFLFFFGRFPSFSIFSVRLLTPRRTLGFLTFDLQNSMVFRLLDWWLRTPICSPGPPPGTI